MRKTPLKSCSVSVSSRSSMKMIPSAPMRSNSVTMTPYRHCASLIGADLLVLLSDIDGLFTDDPHTNPNAELIETVEKLDEKYLNMAKDTTGSDVGTGGMATKLNAARIASYSGADMIIANAKDVGVLHKIFEDDFIGTVFLSNKDEDFYIPDFIEENMG